MRSTKLPFPSSWFLGAGIVAASAIVACGADDAAERTPPDASAALPRDSAGSGAAAAPIVEDGDASAIDASAAADASLPAPGSAFSGRLSMTFGQTRVATDGGAAYSMYASASVYSGHSVSFSCTESTVDAACVAFTCEKEEDASAPVANAGDITITGGSGSIDGGIVLSPLTPGFYVESPATSAALARDTAPYMKAGDSLTFAGAGSAAGIGPFAVTLPAVTDVTVTRPVGTLPEAGYGPATASFPAGRDPVIAWSPGAAPGSAIFVTMSATVVATRVMQVLECSFDPAASQGTVPMSKTVPPFPFVDGVKVTGQLAVNPRASATITAASAGGASTDPDAWTVNAEVTGTTFVANYTMTDGG